MFYRYEIQNNGSEDILYLYLTMKYEFSKELSFESHSDLERRAKNFISTNHIPFQGNRVYLIIDGVVVKSLDISNTICSLPVNSQFSCDSFMVSLKLEDSSTCEISLREYLISILLSKYQNYIHDEVLKAICILFNGYAYKMMKENQFIFTTDAFAIYKPISYYKSISSSFDELLYRLNNIISEVDGFFLQYNNDYILPFIHYSNSGKTLPNANYPYLSGVKSLWDMVSPYYIEIHDFSFQQLSDTLLVSLNKDSHINVISKDHTKRIVFDQKIFSLEEFKNLFDLKSTDLYFIVYHDFLRVITKGWGNSYGLSIFGSNEIASTGANYANILHYYFPKTKLLKYAKELS